MKLPNSRYLLRKTFYEYRQTRAQSLPARIVNSDCKEPAQVLREVLAQKEDYPFASIRSSNPRTIVLDYSSPNIAKPFHAGHLRSTILGNFIGNISSAMGHKVHRINYLGDWGTQCGVVLAAMEAFGSDAELQKNSLKHLLDLYVRGSQLVEMDESFKVRVQEMMNAMESGDQKLLDPWQKIRNLSLHEYLKLYKRIGVEFDEIAGESQYVAGARVAASRVKVLNLSTEHGAEPGFIEKRLLKSDGGSLYLSRDLAAVLDRAERLNFDEMLYIVENGQHDHFQNLIQLAQNFQELKHRKIAHIKFGRIRGLSTRKGQVVLLSDLLDEADQAMKIRITRSKFAKPRPEELESVAQTLALSVILINDFRQRRQLDYENASSTLQQSEGDSGVFLQYVHARLCSLELNSGVSLNPSVDFSTLVEPEALELISHLQLAPSVAELAFQDYEPVFIVQYLFKTGHLVNRAMKTLRVKNQPTAIGEARLALLHSARLISRSFMKILGLKPLDAM